jgi:outer membrane protein assembly factor BamB
LYAFDPPSGKLLWKFDCNPKKATPYKQGGRGEKGFLIGTPVVAGGKCYIAIGQEPDDGPGVGHLWCIDVTKEPTNKDRDLSPVNDNFDPKDPVNKDSGLVWHYGGPIVPKPTDNSREFVFGRTLASVAVHDGLVYAVELSGFLYCLDAKTGEKYWDHDLSDNTWCAPCCADGRVFIGSKSGDLHILKHGKKLEKPVKINMEQQIDTPLVAANGVIYIHNGLNLYAIAEK